MISVDALVERGRRTWGRLDSRPELVNPLDVFTGVRRRFEDFRLKEWVGFTLLHPEWAASMIIQDAKYLATSEIYGFRRATGELHEHAAAGRGSALLPVRLLDGGRCAFEADGYRLAYSFAHDRHTITINIAESSAGPAFSGELELDATQSSPPLAVSSRLGGRLSMATMFTYKEIFPAAGELLIAGSKISFDPGRDFAIVDEHRSHLPYRTDWTWGTFAHRTSAGIVGANFAARPQPRDAEEESCLWTPDACEPLSTIIFTPLSRNRLAPVRVLSADGRLDLIFTPQGRKDARHQFVVASMDYFQQPGTYRGLALSLDGTRHQLDDVPGVLERMHARL
ncbi:MAG: DUF2804 family protein [Microlunatus sp.]|nr:DUF2804 family protein [Microlunatus sp.]